MGGCVGAQHDSSGSLNENSDGTGGRWRQGAAAAPHCSRRRPPVPTPRPFVVSALRRPRHALRAPRGTAGLGLASWEGTLSGRTTRRPDGGSWGRGRGQPGVPPTGPAAPSALPASAELAGLSFPEFRMTAAPVGSSFWSWAGEVSKWPWAAFYGGGGGDDRPEENVALCCCQGR